MLKPPPGVLGVADESQGMANRHSSSDEYKQ